jgi:hypothetical protein
MMRAFICLVADLLPVARHPRDGTTDMRSIEAVGSATKGLKSSPQRSFA